MQTNLSPHEIEKFSSIANQWWDPQGTSGLLHGLNPLRLRYIQRFAQLNQQKVIDIGCGGGILTEALAQAGAITTGIDMSAEVLQVAKLHSLESNLTIDYQQILAEEYAAKHPRQFNVITCMEMLEHVPDPVSVVNACASLIAPNGYVFLSTLNRHPMAYVQAIFGAEYLLNLIPRGTHEYQKFIQPAELAQWLRDAGLHLIDIKGLSYNPFTKNFSISNNVQVNYILCAQMREKS